MPAWHIEQCQLSVERYDVALDEVSGGSQTVRNTHTYTTWSTMQSTTTTLHFILTVKLNQLLQCAPFRKDMSINFHHLKYTFWTARERHFDHGPSTWVEVACLDRSLTISSDWSDSVAHWTLSRLLSSRRDCLWGIIYNPIREKPGLLLQNIEKSLGNNHYIQTLWADTL